MHDDLPQRKSQHLDLVQREEVEPDGVDPLLSCVRLVVGRFNSAFYQKWTFLK